MRKISADMESLAVIVNIEAQNIKNEAKRQIFPRGAGIGIGRQCNSFISLFESFTAAKLQKSKFKINILYLEKTNT